MGALEYRNVELLAAHSAITAADRVWLRQVLTDYGRLHTLTDSVIAEISRIRATAGQGR